MKFFYRISDGSCSAILPMRAWVFAFITVQSLGCDTNKARVGIYSWLDEVATHPQSWVSSGCEGLLCCSADLSGRYYHFSSTVDHFIWAILQLSCLLPTLKIKKPWTLELLESVIFTCKKSKLEQIRAISLSFYVASHSNINNFF